jgi:hypothetical protein
MAIPTDIRVASSILLAPCFSSQQCIIDNLPVLALVL